MKQITNIQTISKDLTSVGYLGASGIDPDIKISDRISGMICPTNYEKILEKANILWLEPNDVNDDIYFYTYDGEFGKLVKNYGEYEIENLGDGGEPIVFDSKGNGLIYHNNYYYIAVGEDIHRYGPLEAPELEENWWSGLSEKESIFNILAEGSATEVNKTTTAISQSMSGVLKLSKLNLFLRNTGTDLYYDIRVVLREKTTDIKLLPSPFATAEAGYTIDVPRGAILAEATISASELSDSFEVHTFEFDEIETPSVFTLTITADGLTPEQSFEVMTSEYGDVYTDGMLSKYSGSWDVSSDINKYDNTEGDKTSTSSETPIYTYTIETKKDGYNVDKDIIIEFNLDKDDATSWFLRLRKYTDGVGESAINTANFTSNQTPEGDWSNWENKSGDFTITIKPSAGFKDGDEVRFYSAGIGGVGTPTLTMSRQAFKPYLRWKDTSAEEDIAIEIFTETLSGNRLTDKKYPVIGNYQVPNHTMFAMGGNVYIVDTQDNRGVTHSFFTTSSLVLKDIIDEDFQVGDVIRGKTSRATATVIKVFKRLTPTGSEIELAINKMYGVFEEDETIESFVRGGEATFSSFIRGKVTVASEMNSVFLDIEEEPVGFTMFGRDICIISNKYNSILNLWDGIAEEPYRKIDLPYRFVSAITRHNGIPYIFGGDELGYSISQYTGGDTVQQIYYLDNGLMPLQGAVRNSFNRIEWGSSQEYPEDRGCVWAIGSRTGQSGLHNIISAGGQVSALGEVIATDEGIFDKGGDYVSIWRSEMMSFGRPFNIEEVIIPLKKEVESGKITINFYYDNETIKKTWEVEKGIYDSSIIKIEPESDGVSNFFIEIIWNTEEFNPVLLPISIKYNTTE